MKEAQHIFDYLQKNGMHRGNLVHTYKEGSNQKEGFLEDYTYLAQAALELYTASFDIQYLEIAMELTEKAEEKYADETTGMYFYNESDELIAKIIKTDDGVLPSPNAVMAHNLYVLGHIEYNTDYTEKSRQMLASMRTAMNESPASYTKWGGSLMLHQSYPYFEIAVVGPSVKPVAQAYMNIIFRTP